MICDKNLKHATTVDQVDFYEYKVRLFSYFYTPMAHYEKLLSRTLRETLDYVRGNYKVVYMGIGDKLIGYGVITRGGGRNRFCTKQDLVLCSLFIRPEHRGHGYANTLVKVLSTGMGIKHQRVYEYIRHDNIPSIMVAQANGFLKISNASYRGLMKNVVKTQDGHLGIYEKTMK